MLEPQTWRNIRVTHDVPATGPLCRDSWVFSDNPVAYKARVIGQHLLHGTPVPANAYF